MDILTQSLEDVRQMAERSAPEYLLEAYEDLAAIELRAAAGLLHDSIGDDVVICPRCEAHLHRAFPASAGGTFWACPQCGLLQRVIDDAAMGADGE